MLTYSLIRGTHVLTCFIDTYSSDNEMGTTGRISLWPRQWTTSQTSWTIVYFKKSILAERRGKDGWPWTTFAFVVSNISFHSFNGLLLYIKLKHKILLLFWCVTVNCLEIFFLFFLKLFFINFIFLILSWLKI
jgi:hypothetical protein